MKNKNLTAVQWLEQEFIKLESTIGVYGIMYELLEQAKQMEREQIVNAVDGFPLDKRHLEGEQYYNETYKSE
jgi:hypothetical protein